MGDLSIYVGSIVLYMVFFAAALFASGFLVALGIGASGVTLC